MIEIELLIKGILVAFAITIPIGPSAILVIKRTLDRNVLSGYLSALGASFGDFSFSLIVGLGVSAVSEFIIGKKWEFMLLSSVILIILGCSTFLRGSSYDFSRNNEEEKKGTLLYYFVSSYFLIATNPFTIMAFTTLVPGVVLPKLNDSSDIPFFFAVGILVGDLLWWIFLINLVNKIKKRLKNKYILFINRSVGLIIVTLGIFFAIRSLYYLLII